MTNAASFVKLWRG